MPVRVVAPSAILQIIESNGNMSQEFQVWTQAVSALLPIIGSGNPESEIEAQQGALYVDQDAVTGDVLYVKRLADVGGDRKQGWRAV